MTPRHPLSQWFERWNTSLQRLMRQRLRLPDSIDAEDLSQEVFLRLLRVKDLGAIAEPEAYLYSVARNVALEWRKRGRESRPHSDAELDELIELTTPETLADGYAQQAAFDEALQRMPPPVRAVLYLKLRDDKSHQEIAAQLGISTRMVRKLLTEGYADLRHKLIKERLR